MIVGLAPEAGDWLILGATSGVLVGAEGVLKAPVESFWRRSNSSCSAGGRRGGEGPVANAGREREVLNVRMEWWGRRGRRRRMEVFGGIVAGIRA